MDVLFNLIGNFLTICTYTSVQVHNIIDKNNKIYKIQA